jgi:phosphatidylserine/phosphatidylglycerophosphate/cardiolipin synthase-like enzyme
MTLFKPCLEIKWRSRKLKGLFLISLLLAPSSCSFPIQLAQKPLPCPSPTVCFSRKGGCTGAIVQELDKAKKSILVQAYSFTSAPIAKALVAAHERGVKVESILDQSNVTAQYTSGPYVANAGISVKIDSAHDIAHNRIMIIDGEIVITASFNFSLSAEDKNAENLLIIRDKALWGMGGRP